MIEFDIRFNEQVFDEIRFADDLDKNRAIVASKIVKGRCDDRVEITDKTVNKDTDAGYVIITDKIHAENLIKAINKAISLKWLK